MTLLRGVTRSKRQATQWMRKAAETGNVYACLCLANCMYEDLPCAREIGHVVEAAGVATPAGLTEGHDVPPDVLTSMVYWLRKGEHDIVAVLERSRKQALVGAKFCYNEG